MNTTFEVQQYASLVDEILRTGEKRNTRAGETYSLFAKTITIDTEKEFPLIQGRKIFYKPVFGELAAMLRGPKHIDDFKKFGCNYWDAWGYENNPHFATDEQPIVGSLKLDYGNSWRDFNGTDQLAELVEKLKNNRTDRRLIVSGWRPDNIPSLSLPCCHMLYQWYVRDDKYLDMVWYQRSVDVMVGLPSNFILAALWNIILAQQSGLQSGRITMVLGDVHIYANHVQGTLEYLRNLDKLANSGKHHAISYGVNKDVTIDTFVPDDVKLAPFETQPVIKFDLNV